MAGRQHIKPERSRSVGRLAIKAPGPLCHEAGNFAVHPHCTEEVLLVPVPKRVVGPHRTPCPPQAHPCLAQCNLLLRSDAEAWARNLAADLRAETMMLCAIR